MRAVHSWLRELVPGLPDAHACAEALTVTRSRALVTSEQSSQMQTGRYSTIPPVG